ncbi:MAG TPA: hypothetical protein VI279_11640 [Rhodocyclaceae bacterium]
MALLLSFEQAPPISVPARFLFTAPLFGVLAGLLLAWQGGEALATRWHPTTLALTHLLVAGLMLQAMVGALFQLVPVVAGGNVWRPLPVATLSHLLLAGGTLALVGGFLFQLPWLFLLAAALLGSGVLVVVAVVGFALLHAPGRGATLQALRAAIVSLAVVAGFGCLLAVVLATDIGWPLMETTDVHLSWGLGGWALALMSGVSYAVVPMFQLTPAYSRWLTRVLLPMIFLALGLISLPLLVDGWAGLRPLGAILLLLAGGLFAGETLNLQRRRRRKVIDTTYLYFRGAMVCALALVVAALLLPWLPGLSLDPAAPVALGILALVGVFAAAVNGMSYKIVPFLVWLHLQRLGGLKRLPPDINSMIPERRARGQLLAHFLSLAVLLPAPWIPQLARPGGLLLALSCAWMWWNLGGALRIYRQFKRQILAAAESAES